MTLGETTVIDLEDGHIVRFGPETVEYDIPGYGIVRATPTRSAGVQAELPAGDVPEWISVSKNRLTVTTDAGRLTVTRNRSEVFRYFTGWELFWFTLDSPYYGKPFPELAGRAMNGEAGAILNDFWTNKMWRHQDVAWAIFETILMAFLGTLGAAMVALPLAFLATRNFNPMKTVRFATRRVFDFVRGVDALIWTVVLARAFGPGPLTGALAILVTDTGTFGKIFSEALENVDNKQIEGVQSTGANAPQRYRFGVIPQVTPVLLSQLLYFLESNTRSATVIGAITGGGIGLLLTQAIITQKDWEEVAYYIVLIILMVMLMDWFSGWLRRRLIQGEADKKRKPRGAKAQAAAVGLSERLGHKIMARLRPNQPFIHPDCQITNSSFGEYVEIGAGSRVANSVWGDYSYCDRTCDIANAEIGKFANIASFTRIGATDHPMEKASQHHFLYRSADLLG